MEEISCFLLFLFSPLSCPQDSPQAPEVLREGNLLSFYRNFAFKRVAWTSDHFFLSFSCPLAQNASAFTESISQKRVNEVSALWFKDWKKTPWKPQSIRDIMKSEQVKKRHHSVVWELRESFRSCIAEPLRIRLQDRPSTSSQTGHWAVLTGNSFERLCRNSENKTDIVNTDSISLKNIGLLKLFFYLRDFNGLWYFRKQSISCKLLNLCAHHCCGPWNVCNISGICRDSVLFIPNTPHSFIEIELICRYLHI